jgi:all-trans-retinol dehydrogenase (NAD+)
MLKAFLPRMIEMDRGYVVSLSSIAGHAGAPNMVPYSASKFAVKGMMEALHLELRQENPNHNIHLMTVSPFIVDTGMIRGAQIRFPG